MYVQVPLPLLINVPPELCLSEVMERASPSGSLQPSNSCAEVIVIATSSVPSRAVEGAIGFLLLSSLSRIQIVSFAAPFILSDELIISSLTLKLYFDGS